MSAHQAMFPVAVMLGVSEAAFMGGGADRRLLMPTPTRRC
jgi:hypothetical protein